YERMLVATDEAAGVLPVVDAAGGPCPGSGNVAFVATVIDLGFVAVHEFARFGAKVQAAVAVAHVGAGFELQNEIVVLMVLVFDRPRAADDVEQTVGHP